MDTAQPLLFVRLEPGERQVMGDVRMVRHTTQTTVTEIMFPEKNLWRPGRFIALFHVNLYLPKGRLHSLMAVHSTTLKSTFIASKSCKLLLLYVTHCSVSKVGPFFHTTNHLFSLKQQLSHTFINYICSWQYFICTKFTRQIHKTDVPIKYWHIPEWWYLVIWVKNRRFGQNVELIRPI
jgi:hypothetical protein